MFDGSSVHRMIQNNPDRNADSRQVDMDNLFRVVQFCENVTECRRAQLLHYFGEIDFNPSLCRSRPDSMCDTCATSASFVYEDITSQARVFVESVNSIVHCGNRNWRKPVKSFTLNHFIDIFKVRFTLVLQQIFVLLSTSSSVVLCWVSKLVTCLRYVITFQNFGSLGI